MVQETFVIPLTQGKFTIVDKDIYLHISNLKWCAIKSRNTFYAGRHEKVRKGKYPLVLLHWLVIGKPAKGYEVDHIDGNGLNNQRDNLRIVTRRKNKQNQQRHRDGKLVGASYSKFHKKWISHIRIDGIQKTLGYFATEQEAHETYLRALK